MKAKNESVIKSVKIASLLLLGTLIANSGFAAVPNVSSMILSKPGYVRGGVANGNYSLLAIRRTASKKMKTERLVIDIGDMAQAPITGALGYYNVELKKNNSLVLDFAQTLNSKFSKKTMNEVIKDSAAIRSAKIHFEPTSQTMSLVFDLKKKATIKVLPVIGKSSKMVIDIIQN